LERIRGSYVGFMTLRSTEGREANNFGGRKIMKRDKEHRHLANDGRERAAKEQSALLRAQWEILGARYTELAAQSTKLGEIDAQYDPIPWDRTRQGRHKNK
jgi:hypothetical protein